MDLKLFFPALRNAGIGWKKDNAPVWCAALSYYTLFSLAPLLLLILSIVSIFFNRNSMQEQVFGQVQSFLGKGSAQLIVNMIRSVNTSHDTGIAGIINFALLILGALGVFGQLKAMVNHIWHVKEKSNTGLGGLLRDRFVNFAMIGVICFILLVSLVISAGIEIAVSFFHTMLPLPGMVLLLSNFFISFIIIAFLFAAIFKILPDIFLPWKYIWPAAICTALLFTGGKTCISLYISHSGIHSEYGAAASIVVILVWVYYASQILFFGVELTKAHALLHGYTIQPSKFSVLEESEIIVGEVVAEQAYSMRVVALGILASEFIIRFFGKRFLRMIQDKT